MPNVKKFKSFQKISKPSTRFTENREENKKMEHSKSEPDPIFATFQITPIVGQSQQEVFERFDALNKEISHHTNTDDLCTPMSCVKYMLDHIPDTLWEKKNIKVLDPCCGNGNFGAYAQFKTSPQNLYYNEINKTRLDNCRILLSPLEKNVTSMNFLLDKRKSEFDLVMANPPYSGGGNKNQSLSNLFIEKSIDILKNEGYLCFVTPNNWMTYNQRNTTLARLLNEGRFLIIDNDVKKYFPGVGSSFTVFIWQKGIKKGPTTVINGYLIKDTKKVTLPKTLKFLPLYLSQEVLSLTKKIVANERNKFDYRCDLHNFTKKSLLNDEMTEVFKYKTIHTARKTRYAKIKQDIFDKWNIIVPLSTYYVPYIVTKSNVTQSVGYLPFSTKKEANTWLEKLTKPEFKVLIHLTRYGNFNNIMLLRHLKFDGGYALNEKEKKEVKRLASFIKY